MKQIVGKAVIAGVLASALAAPGAAQYRNKIDNEPAACRGSGPAVKVQIDGLTPAKGIVRVQLYRGTAADWLKKGRWLNRIEVPAHGREATVCMPVPGPGKYAIAVRHDVNGNGETDPRTDGGGMSNNPAISIFNLGRPGVEKAAFSVGGGVRSVMIEMRYF
ncbi:MAG: DUF2141 domain-containing protein [Croceibacterium sp.]